MSDYLPLELLQQVLLRLPVKSLLRCSSICKAWYNLITSPTFISAHLDFIKSLSNDVPLLIGNHSSLNISGIGPSKRNHVCVLYSDNEEGSFQEYTRFEFSNEKSACHMRVAGLCNGLFCLAHVGLVTVRPQDYEQEVVLWNPMIRRYMHLPKADTDFRLFDEAMSGSFFQIRPSHRVFGFVFDHIGGDYKVLRIHDWNGIPSIVEVFRLSTGLWEDISNKANFNLISYQSNQVDLKGISHWIGKDNTGKSKIITLNVHEEVFGSIGLPVNVVNDGEINIVNDDQTNEQAREKYHSMFEEKYLFIFEESLFLIRRVNTGQVSPEYERKYDIWKMEEYNVVESWKQVHSWIFNTLTQPLGFRKNGEILWVVDGTRLISTNLVDSTSNYLGIYQNGRCYSSYVESLILLDESLPTGSNDQKVEILKHS